MAAPNNPTDTCGRVQAVEDKTFGLKNKNKSIKVQKWVMAWHGAALVTLGRQQLLAAASAPPARRTTPAQPPAACVPHPSD